MSILDQIRQRASSNPQHIVLPEGEDPRTVAAAGIAARQHVARITILGNEDKVREVARQVGVDLGGVELIDPTRAGDYEKMVSLLLAQHTPIDFAFAYTWQTLVYQTLE